MSETSERVQIYESCGCVFCDIGLEPEDSIQGRPIHRHRQTLLGYSFCTNDELDAPTQKGDDDGR